MKGDSMNDYLEEKKEEEYLFKIARAVLKYVEVEISEDRLADLIMLNLVNLKRS